MADFSDAIARFHTAESSTNDRALKEIAAGLVALAEALQRAHGEEPSNRTEIS